MERKGSGNDKDDGSAGSKGAPKGKPKAKPKSASISYIFYIILVSNVYTVLFIYIYLYICMNQNGGFYIAMFAY